MRIVIDMQGAQTESRFRGIGRYTTSFAQAVVRNRGEHEVILALNGLFPETIEPVRAAFDGLLPQENIRVWQAPGPVKEEDPGNDARREVAELIREAFLASLAPDVIHISSLFEGYADDAVTSIGRFDRSTPISVFVHDVAPLSSEDEDFKGPPRYSRYLQRKMEYLKLASAPLSFATDCRPEGGEHIGLAESRIIGPGDAPGSMSDLASDDPEWTGQEADSEAADTMAFDEGFWDECARRAIDRFEALCENKHFGFPRNAPLPRPRLAYVSPLPPERTGIADYSAELLPVLAHHYEIEVVTDQAEIVDPWILSNFSIRSVTWFTEHAHKYQRVLYHVGNSSFHAHMFEMLRQVPGVVVLHDFFVSGAQWFREVHGTAKLAWTKALYESHGYKAVAERFRNPDTDAVIRDYPANFDIIRDSIGVIVHSKYARALARQWYGEELAKEWAVVPLLRTAADLPDRSACRRALGIADDQFVVCSFGFLGPTKCNQDLLDAWFESDLSNDKECVLVFVGEAPVCEYTQRLRRRINESGAKGRIRITGYAAHEIFRKYLGAADVTVQLRKYSRGETSATLLDGMSYALPAIVNANGSMGELDSDAVWMLPDRFDIRDLRNALEALWRNPVRRRALGERARQLMLDCHVPEECARGYMEVIERFYHRALTATSALTRAIATRERCQPDDTELLHLARAIAVNQPFRRPARRLFLDVSATCRDDLKTGIERVTRALMLALIQEPPEGFRIEPVYLTDAGGEWHHRFAHGFTLGLLDCPMDVFNNEIADPEHGDVFLGLDLSGDMMIQAAQSGLFDSYRARGVMVYSVVYDLLPVSMPHVFPPGADHIHKRWLSTVSEFDGAICISQSVAEELSAWQGQSGLSWKGRRPFRVGWFHLGADMDGTGPVRGMPRYGESLLHQLAIRPSFLMVGTIEPRKGYLQVLDEFDRLWKEGLDANLVIVGKEGWTGLPDEMCRDIPKTINGLRTHPELNKRLFWLDGINDEYLEEVYASSTCLIAASYGEGFGLPLIEAAQHKLPIIARDIPVFREVAGKHAYYFHARESGDLADAVLEWLSLHEKGRVPGSNGMPRLTWRESANRLTDLIPEMRNRSGDAGVSGARPGFTDPVGIRDNARYRRDQ